MVNSAPFLLQCCRCRAPRRRSFLISFFFLLFLFCFFVHHVCCFGWMCFSSYVCVLLTSLLVCPPGVLPLCPHKRKPVGPSKVAAKKKKAEMAMSGVDGSMLAGASASVFSCHVDHNCHFFLFLFDARSSASVHPCTPSSVPQQQPPKTEYTNTCAHICA